MSKYAKSKKDISKILRKHYNKIKIIQETLKEEDPFGLIEVNKK